MSVEKFVLNDSFRRMLTFLSQQRKLARFVFDEVHVLSTWGTQFRDPLRQSSMIRDLFPDIPLVITTATATLSVLE
jgi:superfamily II DNA helicase RecQ